MFYLIEKIKINLFITSYSNYMHYYFIIYIFILYRHVLQKLTADEYAVLNDKIGEMWQTILKCVLKLVPHTCRGR